MTETKPRPKTVTSAIYAIIISQLLTAAELVLKNFGIGLPIEAAHGSEAVYYWIVGISIAIYLILALLVYLRKNWARITYIALTAVILVLSLPGMLSLFKKNIFTAAITTVEMIFLIIALVLLAVKNASEWFKNVKEEPSDTAPWFR
jgi:ascorbate-specific PTS system EIIC-type component UlaA